MWRALDGASERLLRASEDMALSELHELRTELEALARQALQTPAAVPGGTSAATGKTSATTENPIAATGNSIAATGKPGAARGNVTSPSSVRALALARAAVALRSTFPPDEALIASLTEVVAREVQTCLPDSRKALALAYLHSLTEVVAREVQTCLPDSRKALALAYLHAATYADRWRRAAEELLRHLPTDALTHEARTLLAALEVAV